LADNQAEVATTAVTVVSTLTYILTGAALSAFVAFFVLLDGPDIAPG